MEDSVDELLKNFFALSSSYNGEWWFLKSYICAVITYPFVEKIIKNFSISINIALIIIGGLLVGNIFPLAGQISLLKGLNDNYLYSTFFCQTSPYIMSFWMGIVVAKDDVLLKLKNSLKENNLLNPFFDIIFFVVIIYLRNTGTGSYLDIIYVPIIIVCSLDFIQKMKIVKKIFMELGKKSTNMWLIHTFFCYFIFFVVFTFKKGFNMMCMFEIIKCDLKILKINVTIIKNKVYKIIVRNIIFCLI